MRCTTCGLPLSPARTMTNCPRCGTPIISDKKPSPPSAQQPPYGESWEAEANDVRAGYLVGQTAFPQTEPWKPVAPQTQVPEVVRNQLGRPESESFLFPGPHAQSSVTFPPVSPIYMPQPTPQSDQMWRPTPASQGNKGSNAQQPPVQEYGQGSLGSLWPGVKNQEGTINRAPTVLASQHQPWQLQPPKRNKSNLGFIVAGLCVITGGLILVFVYFMAIGLPGNSTNNSAVKTNTVQTTSSPAAASSPASSPTATLFPGQKYIDKAQMASSVDPTSRQATQLATTFKANQHIYITFQLHPAGQNGAACLFWYMNNKQFFAYQLTIYPNEQATYSYASYGGTGSGYVEIYWASTTRCSDKILAQHVDFTITT